MKQIDQLIISLSDLKEKVIGLYKHSITDVYELIVNIDNIEEGVIDTVYISNLGGVSECFGLPIRNGQYHLFPLGMNMNDMLKDPFVFNDFIYNNFK
jgi:hypothetical protein